MHTESIGYDVAGTHYIGYLAFDPARTERRPGILICHEGNGLGPQVKERAHRLADLGYVAFAVDYVGNGEVFNDMPTLMKRLGHLRGNIDLVRELAHAGLAILTARPEVDPKRIAATGYCFGGTFALELARSGAPLACVVGFHSGLDAARPEDAKNITGKILVCIGADDPLIPPAQRLAFEAEMRAANVDWRMNLYGGAVHGFANPNAGALGNPAVAYNEHADKRSWRAMLDVFEEVL